MKAPPRESKKASTRPWPLLQVILSDGRRERMLRAAAMRTMKLRLVLQDTFHAHNISACIRTAEAFGVQNVDLVAMRHGFKPTGVTRGVERWMTLNQFSGIPQCGAFLKAQGFHVTGASLEGDFPEIPALTLETLPLDRPIAVVFGNEKDGMDPGWRGSLDSTFTIPMVGLVESLNVSVCAAIALYQVNQRLAPFWGDAYRVTPAEQEGLLDQWICRHFPHWQGLMARMLEK